MTSSAPIQITETLPVTLPTYDAFETLKIKEITGLLDGKASVQVVEISPRIVPVGYTPEYLVVRGARVSYGHGLKRPGGGYATARFFSSKSTHQSNRTC